jgi:hypothetical protein
LLTPDFSTYTNLNKHQDLAEGVKRMQMWGSAKAAPTAVSKGT